MNESRIFLMPMMVDNSKFFQKEKFFPKIFTFLYVGRLVKHKNVEGLIKQFINNFEDKCVVLKIVGSGSEEVYLRSKYASDKILFLGNLYDINLVNEFMNASCFVFPSKFEPWGLVINEALSSGLPVISLNVVGACNDLIKSKNTGLISSDMYEFGNNMLKLYNNFPLLLKYSKEASDFMQNNWNYNFYNKCLLDAIKKVKEWA